MAMTILLITRAHRVIALMGYCAVLIDVTDILGWIVGPIFRGQAAEDCAITQKSEDLIYTKAEA
jgi:hypothetical protein